LALENNYNANQCRQRFIDAQKQKWKLLLTGLPQVNAAVKLPKPAQNQPVKSLLPGELAGGIQAFYNPYFSDSLKTANFQHTLNHAIF